MDDIKDVNQLNITQPTRYCAKCGAEIPDNENVQAHAAVAHKRSGLIACVECTINAGSRTHYYRPATERELERYGQRTVADVCGPIPMIEVR